MLAKKNRLTATALLVIGFACLLAGCMPPGPRALKDGRRLLDAGQYSQAVEKLSLAASLLQTNAQAWNYLGLACHFAGQPTKAVDAYSKALRLDQNLAEARFNLGCLWLEQNKPDLAEDQFKTYTALRVQAVEGFLRLGTAQLRLRKPIPAEESFQRALRLNASNPEALNGIGLAQLQRNRPRDAAQFFNEALKHHPNYPPALLNFATVLHRHLNDIPGALQRYHQYLALKPQPADWDSVKAIVQKLEPPTAPPPRLVNSPLSNSAGTITNESKSQTLRVPDAPRPAKPKPTVAKPTPPPVEPPSQPVNDALPAPSVVTLPPEPVIRTEPESSVISSGMVEPIIATPAPTSVASAAPAAKRSVFQRLNPFRREGTATAKSKAATTQSGEPSPAIESPKPIMAAPPSTRYKYLSPRSPAAGDRAAAERAFAQGAQYRRANRLNEAAAAYNQATQLDASYFDAHYNLGLVAYELRNYRQSLAAWESALAARPDSADARYNFALALKAAGHPRDAANELEKILKSNPNEARAHLVAGNLYAELLADSAKARAHYQRVLELDPRHPQSTAIRYWLVANPG